MSTALPQGLGGCCEKPTRGLTVTGELPRFPRAWQVLQAHLKLPRCILGESQAFDYAAAAAALQRYTRKQELRWVGGWGEGWCGWVSCWCRGGAERSSPEVLHLGWLARGCLQRGWLGHPAPSRTPGPTVPHLLHLPSTGPARWCSR